MVPACAGLGWAGLGWAEIKHSWELTTTFSEHGAIVTIERPRTAATDQNIISRPPGHDLAEEEETLPTEVDALAT